MGHVRKKTIEANKLNKDQTPDTKPEENKIALSTSNLPRGRERGIAKANAPVKDSPQEKKILTISDLPRRNKRNRTAVAKAAYVSHDKNIFKRTPLGPKRFCDYVKDGAWKGRRCFIIGGGPSVDKLDLSLLQGELVIGINRAYEKITPSILYGVDPQLWGWAELGKLGEESKRKFSEYEGYKVWMALTEAYPPDFYLIDVDKSESYKIGSTKRLEFNGNSGYGAINLAAALGANPIYLIGFDMHGDKQGKQKWWHDGYPLDYGEAVYPQYIKQITKFAPTLKAGGRKVFNLNPKSELKCFPFGSYAKIATKKPRIPTNAISVMTKPGIITAITPTGDRPLALALCQQWMDAQTVRPDQWIVVDDGKIPSKAPESAEYIRRTPNKNDPKHTLNINLNAAFPYVRGEKIIIIEDDEYYAPKYIETISKKLDDYEVVGISHSRYYHLPSGAEAIHGNTIHASLAQTSFRSSYLREVELLTRQPLKHYLDISLWHNAMAESRGYLFLDKPEALYVGIKGLPGRKGIGAGHQEKMYMGKWRDIEDRPLLNKWIGHNSQVYVDILDGKLTKDNVEQYFPKITGITVCYNTKALMQRAYESVRKFHPDMPIIIIDGSDKRDPCAEYVKSIASDITTVIQPGYNIGHGNGMHMGINKANTPYLLIFDSDIEMLKSPVNAMFDMMKPDTYGVGYTEKAGLDGYEYGAQKEHKAEESMKMLHPYFQLINKYNYNKYHPYVHHGAPCYLAARDIHLRGLSNKIIKEFPGLGHSSGKGWVWEGKPREYIRHDPAGTRSLRVKMGLGETEGEWVIK